MVAVVVLNLSLSEAQRGWVTSQEHSNDCDLAFGGVRGSDSGLMQEVKAGSKAGQDIEK